MDPTLLYPVVVISFVDQFTDLKYHLCHIINSAVYLGRPGKLIFHVPKEHSFPR